MQKYVFIYTGGSMPETDADREAVTTAWRSWFGGMGGAVSEIGNPFGESKAVSNSGRIANAAPSGLGGYSVITASGLEAAAEIAKGCPILKRGGSVEVYEAIAVS